MEQIKLNRDPALLFDDESFALVGTNGQKLTKAENAYQGEAFVFDYDKTHPFRRSAFTVLDGHIGGWNQLTDRDRGITTLALAAFAYFINFGKVPFLAIAVKHGNACAMVWGWSAEEVLKKLVFCDPDGILGATIITNFPIGEKEAQLIRRFGLSVDKDLRVIDQLVAPEIDPSAISGFVRKDGKTVMLVNPALANLGEPRMSKRLARSLLIRTVTGSVMIQNNYLSWVINLRMPDCEFYRSGELDEEGEMGFILCWAIHRTGNSNQVAIVKDRMLIGNGVGQQARMRAARLAVMWACENGHSTQGAIACSDSFFPMDDGAAILRDAGCRLVYSTFTTRQKRDNEIREEFKKAGISYWQVSDFYRGFSWH